MSWFSSSRRWESGPWSLQLRDDEIADLSYEGTRVLRSVRTVVRDRNWDTAPLIVDRVRDTDVTLTLHVRSEELGSSFRGIVRVEARAAGLVVLTDLESQHPFETNRTGLVVLHPPQLAGTALTVTHPGGLSEQTGFPEAISPHQPVVDIAALAWEHAGLSVAMEFSGDVFEMEDQRNWTDASYKTYSRPLTLPFPYPVAAGERVQQSVMIRAQRVRAPFDADAGADRITLTAGGRFPTIALGAATGPDPAPAVAPIGSEVIVELDLATPNWRAALERAARAGLPLDVRFVLDPAEAGEIEALAEAAGALRGIDVVRVGAFERSGDARDVTDADVAAAVRGALADAGAAVAVIGGSRSHFTELNRERQRVPDDLDGWATTVTPLFHALGTEQLVESVAMQRLVARQTVEDAGGRPVHFGPVCLRPRFNNVATAAQPGPTRSDLSEGYGAEFTGAVDPRQSAAELAAWTIASAAALGIAGVASLAYFEEWGPRGIRTASGDPLPVTTAVEELAAMAGGELLSGESPDGLIWAIGSRRNGVESALVANLAAAARVVTVSLPSGDIEVSVPACGWVRVGR
ncbi:hypothetical protein [Microbacterium sp. Marseille-Q6648]|uniref:hypothetical protein n=1 Tax=Microbacterium sp. Marseille-Q6648 TaxID=2937991 RepID=UPI00203EEA93|nr:hypothetical protein [Microbacterium sp. Marseille-Q6648]